MPEDHRLRGYLLVLLAAACWASGGLTAKWLFTAPGAATADWPFPPLGIDIEPASLSGGRALAAFVVLLAYLLVTDRGLLRIGVRDMPFMAVFGVAGLAMVHYTYFQTISLTNVATAILLEYLAPVLVLAVGVIAGTQKLTWTLPGGVALSVLGCALVVGAIGGEGLAVSPAGIAWGLASAVAFATYSLLGSSAASRFAPRTTLVWGLGAASAFWLVALGPMRVLTLFADARSATAVAFLAVVSTVIPFLAFLSALRHIAPTNATVTSTIEPVLAGIGAWLLFGESFSVVQLLGGLVVIGAILMVQMPKRGVSMRFPPPD